jgi:hypothetical protein
MSDLQASQFSLDRSIHQEVLRSIPSTWVKATLLADSRCTDAGSTQMTVRIDGVGQPGIALVSDELQDNLRGIFLLTEQHKSDLLGLTYSYTREADGRWSFVQKYRYGP